MHALQSWTLAIMFVVGAGLVGVVIGLSIPQPSPGVIAALAVLAVLVLGSAVLWRYRMWRR